MGRLLALNHGACPSHRLPLRRAAAGTCRGVRWGLGGFSFDLEHVGQGEAHAPFSNPGDGKTAIPAESMKEHAGHFPALTEFGGGVERGEGFGAVTSFQSVLFCEPLIPISTDFPLSLLR